MTPAQRSAVRVVVDGTDITPTLEGRVPGKADRRRLVSLTITEKRGDEADQLDIVIDDTDGRMAIPRAGAAIAVAIGWESGLGVPLGLVDKGRYVVEEVEHGGPPDLITIRARAVDFTSEIRTRREQSWHDTTIGVIVADLAKRNGLQPRCATALASVAVASIIQSRESDVAFLRRMGRAHDAVATIKGGRLIFSPVGAGVTPSGRTLVSRSIIRAAGDRHSFRIQKPEEVGTVEASWHDREAAERQTEKAGGGPGKTRRLSRTYPTQAAARAAASAEKRRAGRQPLSLDLTLAMGDPRYAPEQRVSAVGFKASIDAVTWLVAEVTHTIGDRGFATALKLESA